jgi:eukaryotic-like serine/threonine-protein kinase
MTTQAMKRLVLVENGQVRDGSTVSELLAMEKFSLLKLRSKEITITPIMREILEAFRTPQTPEHVLQQVAANNQCSRESIVEAVASFMNRMMKLGALVSEEKAQIQKRHSIFDNWEEMKTFQEFTLLELIGKKSEAYLFKCCRNDDPSALYTLKILLSKKSSSGFLREVKILESIPPHRNIRRSIHASSFEGEFPYLLLEYIDGKSISDRTIKNETPLKDKCKIIHGMLSSINHLHRNNILHGDIHSSNFLADAEFVVHLIDLGMSHRIGEEAAGHGGVANYMAPERLPNHNLNFSNGQGDFLSEIFQLGICLYLLLSGNYPFNAFLLRELAHAIQHEPPPPLEFTRLGEPIPELLSDVVFKALEKKPCDRYQSVSGMLTAWNEAVNTFNNKHENIEFKYKHDASQAEA